jgi:hypothetical protein
VIKKKKRWVGHVTRIERRKMRAKLRWIIWMEKTIWEK